MQIWIKSLSMFSFPRRLHAILDYSSSVFLMLAPAIFGFGEADMETIIPIVAGVMICFYSFFTNYEGGLYHYFPMRVHYLFDLGIGLLVCTSPWVFDFKDMVYKPHFFIGLAFSIIALLGLLPLLRFHKPSLHKPAANIISFN
jgi:hypothetical protein